MSGAERSQYRDECGKRGTRGRCLEESGQGPSVGQRRYGRGCEVLDKATNGCVSGGCCDHGHARLRKRRFAPPKGERGSVRPGARTVLGVVGHRRPLCAVVVGVDVGGREGG